MGRNEIRLRRQRTTARGIDRFRNYNTVLQRHEQTQRIRKIMKVFGYFAALLIIIMILIFLSRWEQRSERKNPLLNNIMAPRVTPFSVNYNPSVTDVLSDCKNLSPLHHDQLL